MSKISKRIITVLVTLIVAIPVIGLAVVYLQPSPVVVPQEFYQSRKTASGIAQELATSINQSVENISLIARYEREGEIQDAIDLTSKELSLSSEREVLAAELAGEMEIMARSINQIESRTARQEALQAVSAQVAAVSRIIPYNNLMEQLMTSLKTKFGGQEVDDKTIATIVENLNKDAKEINRLTKEFVDSLKNFDVVIEI